jgi:hypothetical protein
MRKLTRVSAAPAALLAAAAAAGVFASPPAARAVQPAGPPHQAPSGEEMRQAASAGIARLQPGGPAVLAGSLRTAASGTAGTSGSTASAYSLNWGGYAASGTRFRYVRATFFVPYLDCSVTPDAFSGHWAGLDGLHNSTVEQAGISADCSGLTPTYRAWYEMTPKPPAFQDIVIRPGDPVVASVFYDRRTRRFTLSVRDTANGHHFRHTATCPSAATCQRATAEVISEAPLGRNGYLPLADFRAQGFSGVRVTSQAGQRGFLRSPHWSTTKITTVNPHGAILDQPSSLYRGSTFEMYWLRQG